MVDNKLKEIRFPKLRCITAWLYGGDLHKVSLAQSSLAAFERTDVKWWQRWLLQKCFPCDNKFYKMCTFQYDPVDTIIRMGLNGLSLFNGCLFLFNWYWSLCQRVFFPIKGCLSGFFIFNVLYSVQLLLTVMSKGVFPNQRVFFSGWRKWGWGV